MKNYNKYLMCFCVIYLLVVINSFISSSVGAYFTIPYFMLISSIVAIISFIKNTKTVGIIYLLLSLILILYVSLVLFQDFDFNVLFNIVVVLFLAIIGRIIFQHFNIHISLWGLFFNIAQTDLCIHYFMQLINEL